MRVALRLLILCHAFFHLRIRCLTEIQPATATLGGTTCGIGMEKGMRTPCYAFDCHLLGLVFELASPYESGNTHHVWSSPVTPVTPPPPPPLAPPGAAVDAAIPAPGLVWLDAPRRGPHRH